MRRVLALLFALLLVLGLGLASAANAASPSPSLAEPSPAGTPVATPPPPGPPFPEPVDNQAVYDFANILTPATEQFSEQMIDAIEAQTKAEVVVYTQAMGRDDISSDDADADAKALMDEWGIGRAGINDGLVILFELDTSLEHGQVRLFGGEGFVEHYLTVDELQAVYQGDMLPLLREAHFDDAVRIALARVVNGTLNAANPAPGGDPSGPAGMPPGPPFPEPETDRAVYDFAGILSPDAIVEAESTIDRIEQRTGAEVVVYTQNSGGFPTTEETEAKARALLDQWGVGRKGFDDGLVIFFDMEPNLQHGQVQLYAGPGFEAAFLSNAERQSIYENDMLPHLRSGDFDGALAAALARVDAAATPEHANQLQQARQVNAVVGLIGGSIVLFGLVGWGLWSWRRYGKDPVYLDDPSILMPAPPPDLTAATGALVMDGATSRRALTTAMLDLASRGLIAFRDVPGILWQGHKVGIDTDPPTGDAVTEARQGLNSRRPIGPAEQLVLTKVRELGADKDDRFIDPDKLPEFGQNVSLFDAALEKNAVERGWFNQRPSKVVAGWVGRGVLAIVAGVIALIAGLNIPFSGLTLIGVAAIVGGVVLLGIARVMPAVTMSGAMIRAMLAAYRRTLEKTMAQARSMDQVVAESGLTWLDTPDQAVVWGTALGLQADIETVLGRSLEDVREGRTTTTGAAPYFPLWWQSSSGQSFASAGAMSGSGGSLFSDSGIPDVGGMMSALGTIGNSPSSSGGGGGGFGGGGSGGGGGGAGGGF